jgi:hypothetical protein
MNIGRNDCQRISRRVALTGTALALGTAAAATAVSQAMAQVKISQATAKYQNTPKGDQRSPTAKVRHGCGRQSDAVYAARYWRLACRIERRAMRTPKGANHD